MPRPERQLFFPADLGLALGVTALLLVGSDVALPDDLWSQVPDLVGQLAPDLMGLLLILAGSLPLVFRRIAPVTVFLVCAGASLTTQIVERPPPLPLGVLVALYTVAVLRRPVIGASAALGYLAALGAVAITGLGSIADDLFYTYVMAVSAAVILGYGIALGRAREGLAEQRASELAREQEARTEAAVAKEQARIAREIHDIVAHDLSVIVAQAAAAGRTIESQPQLARPTLAAIESVGRDALHGLRRLVGMLRTVPERAGEEPQPGLDRLPWLLAQVRNAGLPVELRVSGQAKPLSATVELNAYRIIQEALTNTLKHAPSSRASVCLDYGDDSLGIEVRNEQEGPRAWIDGPESPPSTGYGLISMEQRAALLGGDLVAEPVDGRGFRVAARLPVDGGQR